MTLECPWIQSVSHVLKMMIKMLSVGEMSYMLLMKVVILLLNYEFKKKSRKT